MIGWMSFNKRWGGRGVGDIERMDCSNCYKIHLIPPPLFSNNQAAIEMPISAFHIFERERERSRNVTDLSNINLNAIETRRTKEERKISSFGLLLGEAHFLEFFPPHFSCQYGRSPLLTSKRGSTCEGFWPWVSWWCVTVRLTFFSSSLLVRCFVQHLPTPCSFQGETIRENRIDSQLLSCSWSACQKLVLKNFLPLWSSHFHHLWLFLFPCGCGFFFLSSSIPTKFFSLPFLLLLLLLLWLYSWSF